MIIINYLMFLDDVLCVRRDERQKYQQGKPQYSVVEDKWTGYYLERKCQNISNSDSARIKVHPLDFFYVSVFSR